LSGKQPGPLIPVKKEIGVGRETEPPSGAREDGKRD